MQTQQNKTPEIKYGENINLVLAHKLEVLHPYLMLENANEIAINRPKEVYIYRAGKWEDPIYDDRLNFNFLNDFCQQLANLRKQKFNENNPSLSCELPKPYLRYRVQAEHGRILFDSEIALNIRIPSKAKFALESFLLSQNVLNNGWTYEKIKKLIHTKKNILISGGTASGKTSFLNSLMGEIDMEERVVTIEDSMELLVLNPNQKRMAVPKQVNEIYGYADAINNAMRSSPDRLFLGEIDIRNTFSFLRINNTGHEGNLSTLHANNPQDAIKAIMVNVALGGDMKNSDNDMLMELITTAIDYIIQIKRIGKERYITDILNLKNSMKDKK